MWFARKRMKIKRDNKYVFVNPGDEVSEAEHWPNKEAWERQGYIRFLPRESKAVAEDKKKTESVAVDVDVEKVAKKPKKTPKKKSSQ